MLYIQVKRSDRKRGGWFNRNQVFCELVLKQPPLLVIDDRARSIAAMEAPTEDGQSHQWYVVAMRLASLVNLRQYRAAYAYALLHYNGETTYDVQPGEQFYDEDVEPASSSAAASAAHEPTSSSAAESSLAAPELEEGFSATATGEDVEWPELPSGEDVEWPEFPSEEAVDEGEEWPEFPREGGDDDAEEWPEWEIQPW